MRLSLPGAHVPAKDPKDDSSSSEEGKPGDKAHDSIRRHHQRRIQYNGLGCQHGQARTRAREEAMSHEASEVARRHKLSAGPSIRAREEVNQLANASDDTARPRDSPRRESETGGTRSCVRCSGPRRAGPQTTGWGPRGWAQQEAPAISDGKVKAACCLHERGRELARVRGAPYCIPPAASRQMQATPPHHACRHSAPRVSLRVVAFSLFASHLESGIAASCGERLPDMRVRASRGRVRQLTGHTLTCVRPGPCLRLANLEPSQ